MIRQVILCVLLILCGKSLAGTLDGHTDDEVMAFAVASVVRQAEIVGNFCKVNAPDQKLIFEKIADRFSEYGTELFGQTENHVLVNRFRTL